MTADTQTFDGADGLTIVAEANGDRRAIPVLLAHGAGQTRRAWQRVTRDLADAGFRAIAIDMRGHGDSDWSSTGAYDVRDFAADLVAIASGMDRKPALVGASLGGLAGLIAEGNLAQGTFASLTLVDIAPQMEPGGVMRILGFMQEHVDIGFASPAEAADVIAKYMPHRRKRGASEGLRHYLRQKDDGRFYWHWDPAFIHNIKKAHTGSTDHGGQQREQFSKAAASLTLPLHLIRGASSDLVSEEGATQLQRLVPHAESTDIADATHMVVGDANDDFSAAILEFLGRQHTN